MGTAASGGGTYFDMNNMSQTIGPLTGYPGANGPQIKLTGALTIVQNTTTTFNGAISQSGGSLTLHATSTGTLTLAGTTANTYPGPTTVNGGTLELNMTGGVAAMGSTSVTVANGGFLKLDYNTAIPTTATLNLAALPANNTVNLAFSGTQTITALNFGATSMAKGTWGRIGSGALHENAAFASTGNGLLLVTSGGPTPTATSVSTISGTTLSYNLGGGSYFVLLGTNNVAAPLSLWTRLATNGSTPGSFTIPAVGSQPQMFYRVVSY
jgi:autotransporter-associated beta strand protein